MHRQASELRGSVLIPNGTRILLAYHIMVASQRKAGGPRRLPQLHIEKTQWSPNYKGYLVKVMAY